MLLPGVESWLFREGTYMNKKTSTTNTARSRVQPAQLYQQCLRDERQAAKIDLAKLKVILAEILFFGKPLFEPPPVVDEASAIDKETDLRIRNQLWQGVKYRQILSLLRRCSTPGDRLFLLAWWLSQEKICKPEDILGIEVLRRMAKTRFSGLSATDFRHADTVRVWLPYFSRLINDAVGRSVAEIVKLGYDEAAARAVAGKRSEIEAACSWLADRRGAVNVDVPTLRNAYSRIYGTIRPRRGESSAR
jgi:hypothetical protein